MAKQIISNCDLRGFVFDTRSHPNPVNLEPTKSGYTYHITESGKFTTGPFSMKISGLNPGTKYYIRACAHSIAGWSYGDEKEVTTKNKGFWKNIVSRLELEGIEVGVPSGIKFRIKIRK